MKVKELIKALQQQDQELLVYNFDGGDAGKFDPVSGIVEVITDNDMKWVLERAEEPGSLHGVAIV